jgi:hypothetical protein
MICFETRPMYHMKGCAHTICMACADQMNDMPSSIVYPLSNVFTVKEGVKCLTCPYCRTREPCKLIMNDKLKKAYNLWMQLELTYDGEKSYVQMQYRDYYCGKARPYEITWTVYTVDVSMGDFDMATPYKHQKKLYCNPIRKQKHPKRL